MKVNVITAYVGSEQLVVMTEKMLDQLSETIPHGHDIRILALNNGAVRRAITHVDQIASAVNLGVAKGFNFALTSAERMFGKPEFVLMLNNDMRFPQREWLEVLLASATRDAVWCPGVNRTATAEAVADGPLDKPPTRVWNASAYCWLIPQEWIEFLRVRHGFTLFDPAIGMAYGEDNWTALLWLEKFSPKPFAIEHRAWIDHLKAQSAKEIITAKERLDSSRALRGKVEAMLKRAKRADLVSRCRWYLKVLDK